MKRVVPLDEVTKIEAKLRAAREPNTDISDGTVASLLGKLKTYPLTKEMLVKTRVGRVVKKLTSHRAAAVRAVAKELVRLWTELIGLKERPKIEVKEAKPLAETRNERDRQSARGAITARLAMQLGVGGAEENNATHDATVGGAAGRAAAAAASGQAAAAAAAAAPTAPAERVHGADASATASPALALDSAQAAVAGLAVEVEDQLYAHAAHKIGKHYNRFQAVLM